MTVTKKLIGRLPILLGEYDSTKTYSNRQRVTLYGSEFESKIDNNTTAPAILSNGTLTINTSNWRVVSNGTEAFLAGEKIKQFTIEDDPEERLSVELDVNNKIISYRDKQGTLHENSIKVNNIDIDNISNFDTLRNTLVEKGYMFSPIEWSNKSKVSLPIPKLAIINFTSFDGKPISWPTSKLLEQKAWMQFWDMQGNYFRKRVLFKAQGNSSMSMPKKNGAIDICNDEWVGDDTFNIKFGDWVSQDSFHLKAYYSDYFVGVAMTGYSLFKDIINSRSLYNNRDWKRYLLPSLNTILTDNEAFSDYDDKEILCDEALCFPYGFPCIVFLDERFWGIYSFQIKKHRNNYMMDKKNYFQIHLDGTLCGNTIFNLNGNLDWDIITGKKAEPDGDTGGFEIRNPKTLICIDGKKYDADNHNVEIIGTESASYDNTNKDMVNTAKVKKSIVELSKYIPILQSMADGGSTVEKIRAKIEENFDTISLIDYLIFSDVTLNTDGFKKNWQWITYNGSKWIVEPYDLDGILGRTAWQVLSPTLDRLGNDMTVPSGWIIKYYTTELEARYKELRYSNIISVKNILGKLQNWTSVIGSDFYNKEHEKWPYNKATYSLASTDYTRKDSLYRVQDWLEKRIEKCDTIYNYNK